MGSASAEPIRQGGQFAVLVGTVTAALQDRARFILDRGERTAEPVPRRELESEVLDATEIIGNDLPRGVRGSRPSGRCAARCATTTGPLPA